MWHLNSHRANFCWICLVIAAGAAGYFVRGFDAKSVTTISGLETPGLEFFFTPRSFSEVENTRALLNALGIQRETEIRQQIYNCGLMSPPQPSETMVPSNPALPEAVRTLEEAVEEFKDTSQETMLQQDLLVVLKSQKLYDRWLEIYLSILYERPTQPLVGRAASEALRMGHLISREEEVLQAFRHVITIPLDFEAKHRIQQALLEAQPGKPFGQNEEPIARSHP